MRTQNNRFRPQNAVLYQYWAKVDKVVDGDTVDLTVSLGFELSMCIRARLQGVNAPEMYGVKHSSKEYKAGLAAKRYLVGLIPQAGWIEVKIEQSAQREKYGRWLAELFTNGVSLNQEMVKSKHATR